MTDKQLAEFGERLYEAVLLTPLPAGTILGLATAIRYNVPWADLPRALRFAVFKVAAASMNDAPEARRYEDMPDAQPATSPAAVEKTATVADSPSVSTPQAAGSTVGSAEPPTTGSAVADSKQGEAEASVA